MLRIAKTETGMVRGFPGTDARVTVFKGIPFADNTSGDNRWKAPQPAKAWEGIRDCYEFAPISMQNTPGKDPEAFYSKEWHVDSNVAMSEDGCLALNIWSPAKSADEKLPVMVWIFGGGLQEGYAYEMEFDGERIASRGVILVTVAYRVNVFGFLFHPELTAENPEAPGNFGFLDQKAGIEWVKRNISNFGGDPDNITILGQSSGGVSVFSQMCSPQTEGLFQKAIIQSSAGGSVSAVIPTVGRFAKEMSLEEAEQVGVKFFEELGVKTLAEARKLDAKFVLNKMLEGKYFFTSVPDGKFMTKSIKDYIYDNELHDVPFMLGYTGNEVVMAPKGETIAEMEEWIKGAYADYADEYIVLTKEIAGDDAEAFKKAASTNLNNLATRFIADEAAAQGRKVFAYAFDPEMPGDDAGSFHSSDLWFSFETLMKCWRPFTGKHYDLARNMCNYWTNFAKNGDPNGNDADGTPMVTWRQYTLEDRNVIDFFDTIAMENDGPAKNFDLIIKANTDAFKK